MLLLRQTLATRHPVFDGACFHAQQCAEKYQKAYMQENVISFPRTLDLDGLAALIDGRLPDLDSMREDLEWLTTYAVDIRYPGAIATQVEADCAHRIATAVPAHVLQALGLAETDI